MKVRHSCDRSVVLGRPPVGQSGDFLGIDPELVQGGLDLLQGQGEGDEGLERVKGL